MPERSPVWTRAACWALCLVVLSGMILGWLSRSVSLSVAGDDSIYLTLSRSIAAGHYRDDYLVGAPPHAQYPPGMPIWLLLIRAVAGPSLEAVRCANLLLLGLTTLLLADAVRRLSTPWLAVTTAAVVITNPALLAFAGGLFSEIPYLACCALALWCSLADTDDDRTWFATLAIAAAIAAFLTRSAGIALVPAVLAALALRRRWRAALVGGGIALLVIVAWFSYTRWAGAQTVGHTYAVDLAAAASIREPVRFISHTVQNATAYLATFAAVQFSIPDVQDQPIDNGLWGLLLLIPAAVGGWMARRRWPAVVVFVLLSAAVLLVFTWTVTRLLSVLLPWLIALILLGWLGLASAAGSRHGTRVACTVGMILAGFGLVAQLQAVERQQGCRTSAPFVDPRCYLTQDREYYAAVKYIRDSLPEDAVIAASKPSGIYTIANRQTMPLDLFGRVSLSQLVAPEGPVSHVVLSHMFPYEWRSIAPRLLEQCASLALVRRFPLGTLLLGPRTSDGTPDACAALTGYRDDGPLIPDDESE